jgi:formamidopyrimidine-DNA glycosylase
MDYVEQYIRAQQLKEVLQGKKILQMELTPHFDTQLRLGFSYFSSIDLTDKRIETVFYKRGKIAIQFETDIYMQMHVPEVLYHEESVTIPEVYGIKCILSDNTYLTIHAPGMNGFLHVIPKKKFEERNGLPLHTRDKDQLHAFDLDQFTYENFRLQLLSKTKTMISNAITIIGDIGYIPDVLYTARINPRIKTGRLTEKELHKLYDAIMRC